MISESLHGGGIASRPRRLGATVCVRAPAEFTLAYVTRYFEQRSFARGGRDITVRVPLYALAGNFSRAALDVEVRYVPRGRAPHEIGISWTAPGQTAVKPHFIGLIDVDPLGEEASRLTLYGRYAPPGSPWSERPDALAGRQGAIATIEALLRRLRTATEIDRKLRVT